MNPIITFGVAVSALLVGGLIFFFSQQYNNNYYYERTRRERSRTPPRNIYNLTCPYCGNRISQTDCVLRCGHACHESCFLQKVDKKCRFCYNIEEIDDDETLPSCSSEYIDNDTTVTQRSSISKKKIALSPCTSQDKQDYTQPSTSKTNIDNGRNESTKENSQIQMPSTSTTLSRTRLKCFYCETSIEQNKLRKISCKHYYAHADCEGIFNNLMKCDMCEKINNY